MDLLDLQVAFIYNQRDQVLAVLNGSIDVALVNAEIPQQMGTEGLIDVTQLKVLSPVTTQQHQQLLPADSENDSAAGLPAPPITFVVLGAVRQLGLPAPGSGAAASCLQPLPWCACCSSHLPAMQAWRVQQWLLLVPCGACLRI